MVAAGSRKWLYFIFFQRLPQQRMSNGQSDEDVSHISVRQTVVVSDAESAGSGSGSAAVPVSQKEDPDTGVSQHGNGDARPQLDVDAVGSPAKAGDIVVVDEVGVQVGEKVFYGDSIGLHAVSRYFYGDAEPGDEEDSVSSTGAAADAKAVEMSPNSKPAMQAMQSKGAVDEEGLIGLFRKPARAAGLVPAMPRLCVPPLKAEFAKYFEPASFLIVDPAEARMQLPSGACSCISAALASPGEQLNVLPKPAQRRPLRYDEPFLLVDQGGHVWTDNETNPYLEPGLPDARDSLLVVFRRVDASYVRKDNKATAPLCGCCAAEAEDEFSAEPSRVESPHSASSGGHQSRHAVHMGDAVLLDVVKLTDYVSLYGWPDPLNPKAQAVPLNSPIVARTTNFRSKRTRALGGYVVSNGKGHALPFTISSPPPTSKKPSPGPKVKESDKAEEAYAQVDPELAPRELFNINCMNEDTLFVWQVVAGVRRAAIRAKVEYGEQKEPTLKFTREQLATAHTLNIPNPCLSGSRGADPNAKGGTVEMKDYAPEVFRQIRLSLQISTSNYLDSWKYSPADLPRMDTGAGRSGSMFMVSRNGRFLFKTIPQNEVGTLLDLIQDYCDYVARDHLTSRLMRFVGLHRFSSSRIGKDVYLVVGTNTFFSPMGHVLTAKFDLKGRKPKREMTEAKPAKGAVWKDNQIKRKFYLPPNVRDRFVEEVRKDVAFLKAHHVMDYSLLIGVFDTATSSPTFSKFLHLPPRSSMDGARRDSPVMRALAPPRVRDSIHALNLNAEEKEAAVHLNEHHEQEEQRQQQLLEQEAAAAQERARRRVKMTDEEKRADDELWKASQELQRYNTANAFAASAVSATDDRRKRPSLVRVRTNVNWSYGAEVGVSVVDSLPEFKEKYHISIIDFLAFYGLKKKTAHFFKSFLWEDAMLSTIPPDEYAERFMNYVEDMFPKDAPDVSQDDSPIKG